MSSSGSPGTRSVLQTAADLGGVAGPVLGGGVLPGDGDFDVDAEQAAQDGGGQLGGELEQRRRASLPGPQAELAEPLAEPVGADGRPGCPPGNSQREMPWSPSVAWPAGWRPGRG